HGPDTRGILRVADREDPHAGGRRKQLVAPPQLVAQDEAPVTPFLHPGVDLDVVAVAAGQEEVALGGDDRRADDAARGLRLAPVRHAGRPQEVARAGVEPGEEVGMEGDPARVAVAELDVDPQDVLHAVRAIGPRRAGCARRRRAQASSASSSSAGRNGLASARIAAMSSARTWLISSSSMPLGMAPGCWNTMTCSLNTMRVGIERIPK